MDDGGKFNLHRLHRASRYEITSSTLPDAARHISRRAVVAPAPFARQPTNVIARGHGPWGVVPSSLRVEIDVHSARIPARVRPAAAAQFPRPFARPVGQPLFKGRPPPASRRPTRRRRCFSPPGSCWRDKGPNGRGVRLVQVRRQVSHAYLVAWREIVGAIRPKSRERAAAQRQADRTHPTDQPRPLRQGGDRAPERQDPACPQRLMAEALAGQPRNPSIGRARPPGGAAPSRSGRRHSRPARGGAACHLGDRPAGLQAPARRRRFQTCISNTEYPGIPPDRADHPVEPGRAGRPVMRRARPRSKLRPSEKLASSSYAAPRPRPPRSPSSLSSASAP